MTTFIDFCCLHGVLIDHLPPIGVWRRYKTEDKPSHRNGAVKFMGDHGFVQNHATMQDVAFWRSEGESPIAAQRIQQIAAEAARETALKQRNAAAKAAHILAECRVTVHPYLAAKGFPEERGNVWRTEAGDTLVVPMRVGRDLVGVQLISEDGTKKFLFGQRCSLAQYVFTAGSGLPHILCEGYATALSARLAMGHIKRPYALHVCFSAGNMKKVAEQLPGGVVLADNDASGTGERVAKEIGWPYWMSDRVGEDANDYHQRRGLFALSQGIAEAIRKSQRERMAA